MRINRETKTVKAMIYLHCRGKHGAREGLCDKCQKLLAYAEQRLRKCPFQERKTVCSKCPVHCYRPAMREEIQGVMRYAGPRMIGRHPLMALLHMFDGLRKKPKTRKP